jgi:hypothetical protein
MAKGVVNRSSQTTINAANIMGLRVSHASVLGVERRRREERCC